MPLTLPLGDKDQGWVTVSIDNHDGKGPVLQSALPTGQTLTPLVSPDPATFTLTMDATPVVNPTSPTVASFVVASAATPAQPNVALTVTLTVLNADGSTAAKATDTVTVSETATEAVGDLFGTPVAIV